MSILNRYKKNKKHFKIFVIMGGALVTLLLLFLVIDSFTLYWFMLFNNNQAMERRQQGTEWYDDVTGSGAVSVRPGGSSGSGSYFPGGNYGNTGMIGKEELEAMTPEEAIAAVSRILTEDEKYDFDSAMRMFIYVMDRYGFVPNATIGAISNMMAEAGTMGLYSYESHYVKSNPGPDGSINSRVLDNQAWLDWIDGPGMVWARDQSSSYRNKVKYAIGLGLVQVSDIWSRSTGEKTQRMASELIEAAMAKGQYWQEPGFQIAHYMEIYFRSEEPFGRAAWDTIQSPGVDPTKDAEVTAWEWAARVYCGVEQPSLVYTKAITLTSGDYHDQIISHTDGIAAAEALYYAYSKVDPWFYTSISNSTTNIMEGNPIIVESSIPQPWPCPACGAKNASESTWRCPFCGPEYDNSTYQGLVIARTALLLASKEKHLSTGNYSGTRSQCLGIGTEMVVHAYATKSRGGLYACCAGFASEVLALSGVGPLSNYERCMLLETEMQASGDWVLVKEITTGVSGKLDTTGLQPGDVIMHGKNGTYVEGASDCPKGFGGKAAAGHVGFYVGTNVGMERWSDLSVVGIEASVGNTSGYYPCAKDKIWIDGDDEVRVWRCINPYWNSTLWTKTIAALEADSQGISIPKTYPFITSN